MAKQKYAFKIGITNDPVHRFLRCPYAYMNKRIHAKDNIYYTGMKIILCSESREVVGMLVHSLIEWVRRTHQHLCANKAKGVDSPAFLAKFGDSDTDDGDPGSPGPHFCYVAFRPALSPMFFS